MLIGRVDETDGTDLATSDIAPRLLGPRWAVIILLLTLAVDFASASTSLSVSKSGNDVVLSWTGTGTTFAGARATDGPFTSAATLFTTFGGASYTYLGAVSNTRILELFDVSDETEPNRGGNWNGGVLPPPPPVIDTSSPTTNIGSLFIGSAGTIVGSGFSVVPGNNTICFSGGVCTQATTATATQIQFVTPPGALSGGITVSVGDRISDSKTGTVTLADPASGWTIRTIGFSRQDKSYWMAGTASANTLYRVYFDALTGKWLKEDRGGGFSGQQTYCSTTTSRTGRVYCGLATVSTNAGGARVAETSPPGNMQGCITFASGGGSNNVRGAAVDPNPNSVSGRDMAYFAFANDGNLTYSIRQVAADCSTVVTTNYGNMNWFNLWNAIVGMAVDPVNGDLYVAAKTNIYKIALDQSVVLVKGGFTSVNGIDVYRQGTNDQGVLLVADGGASNTVKLVRLDNAAAAPLTVATSSGLRAASFGVSVSGGAWLASNVNRAVVINNNGNSGAVDPLLPFPSVDVTPTGPFSIRISSPLATPSEQAPVRQTVTRPATAGNTGFSQALTELTYKDGISRFTCAWVGDPGAGAPQYDTAPSTPTDCQKPRAYTTPICDNKDDIVIGGPGSFVESGNPLQSCKTCGAANAPCHWEFRITNRDGGDNYKVFFGSDAAATEFVATSDVYTAWKHVHLEHERMCSKGGLLFADYGATGECGGGGQPSCCGTGGQLPCNQIRVFDSSNVVQGDSIIVFDEVRPFETVTSSRTITAPPTNNGDGSLTITLDSPLLHSVLASNHALPSGVTPVFSNGHSGGFCTPAAGYEEADITDLADAFGEAFVSYHIPVYGLAGSGTVPRYNSVDFTNSCVPSRFSNIWFNAYVAGGTFACPDTINAIGCAKNNYMHVLGAFQAASGDSGDSVADFNLSYLLTNGVSIECSGTTGGCTPVKLGATNRKTTRHELAHQFRVNKCSGPTEHDTRNAWCGELAGSCINPTYLIEWCPMQEGSPPMDNDMRADGIDHFCKDDLIDGDPACGGTPKDGAIRTTEDPQ